MRKYLVYYRRGKGAWGILTPSVHAGLYQRPEIDAAKVFLHDNPAVEGIAIRLDDELFNLVVTADPKAENTFALDDPTLARLLEDQ